VRNATPIEVDGIAFHSKLEARIYKTLYDAGYCPQYENMTFNIAEGFYPTLPCIDVHYDYKLKRKVFGFNKIKVQAITYTPDFTFYKGDYLIIIEAKGRENDVFPLKKKLFRSWMESYHRLTGKNIAYFEIFNKKQAKNS
jgi:hypothetical protein